MEEAFCTSDSLVGPPLDTIAFDDFMDEFFSRGFSDFSQKGDTTSASILFDSSNIFSPVDINNLNQNQSQNKNDQNDAELSVLADSNPYSIKTPTRNQSPLERIDCSGQSSSVSEGVADIGFSNTDGQETTINPTSAPSRRRWVDPRFYDGSLSHLKERLFQALNYIKANTPDGDVLVQIWVPVKTEGRVVLTTRGLPFALDPNSDRLMNYRAVSMNYQFSAEENSNELMGLPGRVFLGKLPEWTPDVQFYSNIEYPRVDYAQRYNVRGTIAIPIFEQGSQSCLGVLEVVMTTQRINYRPELENICRALQAVNLRSSEDASIPRQKVATTDLCKTNHFPSLWNIVDLCRDHDLGVFYQVGSDCYQAALPGILEVLRSVCEIHILPLAQTWMSCIEQGKKGSRHSDENYMNCVSPVDGACHVSDPRFWGFQDACSEHHLFKGQGVAGKAFTTNQPCFSADITAFSKSEYPLVHYARMFGLQASVAIRMRSIYTGNADYVLEFLLPVDCRDSEEQKLMLNSLSMTIQRVCWSLRVVTDKELEDETLSQLKQASTSSEVLPKSFAPEDRKSKISPSPLLLGFQKPDIEGFNASSSWLQSEEVLSKGEIFSEFRQHHQDSAKQSFDAKGLSSGEIASTNASNTQEKKRAKAEKNISLQVLRQYFAGSLKDAAKSIGVCPTTLKRICRQHGISRWPSRKIKKVDHSIKRLQVVINSVQGAGGSLSSLYASLPKTYASDLTSPNLSVSNILFPSSHPSTLNTKPEGPFSTEAVASKSPSSSGSQGSSSSHSCSSGAQQCGIVLKRAHSEVALHGLSLTELKPLARSNSHKSLTEHPAMETPSLLPKNSSLDGNVNGSIRAKVAYGEENVRFRIQSGWSFRDLKEEIAKRFHIVDVTTFDLKYLDDDFEWVLLTCDADLQECIDIYKSCCSSTIKLSIHNVALPNTGNSLGSTALS